MKLSISEISFYVNVQGKQEVYAEKCAVAWIWQYNFFHSGNIAYSKKQTQWKDTELQKVNHFF